MAVVVAGSFAVAATAAAARHPTPRPTVDAPQLCVETRGSAPGAWETIGDINALESCKDKPGSIRITFAQLFPGVHGPAGPRGPAGARGATGPAGPRGPTGPRGPVGAAGAKGATGANGATGGSGGRGTTGPQGPTGLQGPAGATGSAGATGANGATGRAGASGATGDRGPTGLAGSTGATGRSGATGPQGPTGVRGPTGAAGATGPAGPSTSAQIFYSSGADNLGNNSFVGLAGVSGTEVDTEQIIALPQTYTSMSCYIARAPAVNITFTLRVGATASTMANTNLTCTILAGQLTGTSPPGASASIPANALTDIGTPSTGVPSDPGSFALAP